MKPEHEALLHAFEAAEIPNAGFRHRDHLLMAWLYLRRDGLEQGAEKIVAGIQRFAAAKGVPAKYNHTETLFWIKVLNHLILTHPAAGDFDALTAQIPHLLDSACPCATGDGKPSRVRVRRPHGPIPTWIRCRSRIPSFVDSLPGPP